MRSDATRTDSEIAPPMESAHDLESLVAAEATHPAAPSSEMPVARGDDDFLFFYGLRDNPFADSVNPAFFFRTQQHEESFIRLMLAVRNDLSLALVTGPSGSGKTLVSQVLLTSLDPAKYQPVLVLVIPGMSKTALLKEILSELDIPIPETRFVATQDLLKLLSDHIVALDRQGRRLILLIDECHLLSAESLHILRTITNIELPQRKLVTVLLFAEQSFLRRLEHPSYDSLRNRMYMKSELPALTLADTEQYVSFRLLVSGRTDDLFERDALSMLHEHSLGVCRNINKLGMLCLLEGFLRKADTITAELVQHCAASL